MRFLRSRPGVTFFAFLWLLVLFVPVLQEPLRVYSSTQRMQGHTLHLPHWFLPPAKPSTVEVSNLLGRFRLEQNNQRQNLLEFEKIATKYPKDAVWILALRLRLTTTWGIQFPEPPPPPTPKNAIVVRTPRLDKSALQDAIQCARKAQTLDPKNAYFPQMEAVFHFGVGDNASGLKALQQGAKCSTWNDYIPKETYMSLDRAQSERPLFFEDKVSLWAAVLLPHYAPLRGAHRLVNEQAISLLKQGKKKQALALFEVVLRNGHVMRTDNSLLIGNLVGRAIESLVWNAVEKVNGKPSALERTEAPHDLDAWKKRVAPFIALCQANGRPDLVKFTLSEIHEIDTENPSRWYVGNEEWFGMPQSSLQLATTTPFFAAIAALLAWCAALFWIFGQLWPALTQEEAMPKRGQIVGAANFSFWAIVGAFALLAWNGVGAYFTSIFYGGDRDSLTSNASHGFFSYILLALWLAPVALISWRQSRKNPIQATPSPDGERQTKAQASPVEASIKPTRLRWQIVVTGVFLILAAILGSISFLSDTEVWENTPLRTPIPLLGFFASVLIACFLSRDSLVRLSQLRTHPAWAAFTFGFGSLILIGCFSMNSLGSLIWVLPLCALVGLVLIRFRNVRLVPNSTDMSSATSWQFALRLAGQTAGVLSLGFSVIYILLALIIWPTRAQLNRNFDTQLKMGEMSWHSRQVALHPNRQQASRILPPPAGRL